MVRCSRVANSWALTRRSGGRVIETVLAVRISDIVKQCQAMSSTFEGNLNIRNWKIENGKAKRRRDAKRDFSLRSK